MINLYRILIASLITLNFVKIANAQDTKQIKKKVEKIVTVQEPKKLLLHKMDPNNFNFGVGINANFNLIGSEYGNRVGNFMSRYSIFFSKPVNKYYINRFISIVDYEIEPLAINFIESRDKSTDNQFGGYYFDPSFALQLVPDRSSTDFKFMLGIRPSYLMYSYSQTLENGVYRLIQGGLETNKSKAGDIDFAAMVGFSFKFSQVGNFEIKYIHSFTNNSTNSYISGRPNTIEFGIKLSAVQIGKTLFDFDNETKKQVIKLSNGTLLVMFPTPSIHEINALILAGKTEEANQIYFVQQLNNKMIIDKMKSEYKFSKVLYFSDSSINKILAKDFKNVFVDENYQPMEALFNFDSTNFLIASFCFDISDFSSRNKLAYGLHVYNNKMELLSKPFNTMRNDMGLVQGNNIFADLFGKKVLFTPLEYENVIRKFNDRLLKNKLQEIE
jgi:hypothetical protein